MCLVDLTKLVRENLENSIRRCIELKGLKNNTINEVTGGIYMHINSRGKESFYTGFNSFNKYRD